MVKYLSAAQCTHLPLELNKLGHTFVTELFREAEVNLLRCDMFQCHGCLKYCFRHDVRNHPRT
eukprot:m.277847 g.277847  ORF g.277847 m.277847 type:complete len:63 (+) comp15732_c4_seq7:3870-4058(+)